LNSSSTCRPSGAYRIDFRERGVNPADLVSVGAILDLIERGAA